MRIKTVSPFVVALAFSIGFSARAGEEPKPANAGAQAGAEAKAKADYDAAEKAAKEADAAIAPLRAAMQGADTAYANASRTANAKRQQATDAKNLAGEPGAAELKQAEANLPASIQALTDATNAKPPLDKAFADAKAVALPLQQAYDAAEKAAKEAEAAAKAAADAANKLDDEAKKAAAEATAKRRVADGAAAALARAQQNEQKATAQANTAPQKLAEAEAQKKAADDALAPIQKQVAAATTAYQAAEQAAQAAEADAKAVSDAEKQQAATDAAAKRKAADAAKAALTQAQQNEQQAQTQATAAAQKLADAPAQKKAADDALAGAKNQVAAANGAHQAAEQAAQAAEAAAKAISADAAKSPEEKKKAADDAAAKRKAADAAKAALTQAQQNEQQAQAQVNTAAKNLADAPVQKKAADDALAGVKNQVAAANGAYQAAEQAAQGAEATAKAMAARAGRSPEQKQQAAADAAAKRQAANAAKAVLAQAQAALQNPQKAADGAAQKAARAAAQKKVADSTLASAKNQVAAATAASQAAEQAAQAAAKAAEEKNQVAAQAAAKRKVAADAGAALAQAQQAEQQAQAQATAVAQKAASTPAEKKAADDALAAAKNQVTAATAANQAAQEAGKEPVQLETVSKQAAADAAAKRQAANTAKAALAPVAQKLEQAAIQANAAAQNLTRAEARKKSAEEGLESLKKRIASAKQTHVADEEAAKVAEAAAVPLKAEADKTRAAYEAALKVADAKRTLAEQAKTVLYRLVAAREVASLMESPDSPKPANRIDEIVFAKLKTLGIQPVLCSDAVFIRRAYLDLTGKLPSAEEAKAFIQSPDKNKRVALIDRLLDQPAHFDYWAMKWSDVLRVKAEFPVKIWPNAAQAYHRWIWEALAQNKRYDQFARELLTSSGSNFRIGSVNFYRAIQNKTPEGIGAAVGLALMGTRIRTWPEDRRAGMAVFFSQVGYKPTSEWKEEIVFWDPLNSVAVPGSIARGIDAVAKSVTATNEIPGALAQPLSENGPLAVVFPDGTKATIPPNRDPREVFADWLIRPENPWFAKNIVNRTWAWVMGRGIVHEPDDIRDNNPPSNPELLAYLEKELITSGYDLRALKRLIFTSTVYQFSSIPRFKGPEAKANFATYVLRRVEAEVLIDALNDITGSSDLYTSAVPEPFTYIPRDMGAVQVADGSVTSSFLTLFGRSSRSTGMESERVNELASPQWLHMLNSATLQNKLRSGPKLVAMLSSGKPNEIAESLYLTVLSRFPTDADIKTVEEYAKTGVTKGHEMWIDLTWALINSPEFLLRH
jgi:hypothetical protein